MPKSQKDPSVELVLLEQSLKWGMTGEVQPIWLPKLKAPMHAKEHKLSSG